MAIEVSNEYSKAARYIRCILGTVLVINAFPLIILITSCTPASQEDLAAIEKLNQQYPGYEFSPFTGHVIPNYLKVRLKNEKVDSVQIKHIYSEILSLKAGVPEKKRVPWSYLIIYNKDGKYLFTVSGNNGETRFFKDDVQ